METLSKAFTTLGINAKEMEETLNTLNEIINYINISGDGNLTSIRSALDDLIETPNQNNDLEISNQIVWDEDFLKILTHPDYN